MLSPVEEIKSRLDIVDLVREYIKLDKAGANLKANCPFHTEKTPSFMVNPSRQIWRCFGGCSEGGDIFSFIMKIEGMEFPEALDVLAKRAGVVLRREDPRIASERKRLYDICEVAAGYFEEEFAKNEAVKRYMRERGVSQDTIEKFRIGFAPDSWRDLLNYLVAKKFNSVDIEKAGLVIKKEPGIRNNELGNYYDRFRSRVIFPINDASGRVIGFGGRIFAPSTPDVHGTSGVETISEAKYINSPQTPIYDKSRVLYAFDKAKQEIRKKDQCILVEGYMDAIMCHQAGFINTVAVSGTALTEPQIQMLKRITNRLISSFDGDRAGELATSRSLDLAAAFDFERKVAVIPKDLGKDPADVILKDAGLWKKILDEARDVIDFYFEKALVDYDRNSPSGKKEIAKTVLPKIGILSNEIERSHWMKKLSSVLGVSENSVWQEFQKFLDGAGNSGSPSVGGDDKIARKQKSRKQDLEEKLLGMLLLHPQKLVLVESHAPFVTPALFSNDRLGSVYAYLIGVSPTPDVTTTHGGGSSGVEPGGGAADSDYHNHLKFQSEVFLDGISDIDKEIKTCYNEFLRESIKGKLKNLSDKIISAEKEPNQAGLSDLMREFQELSGKLHAI